MVDRSLLQVAREAGYNIYFDGKNVETSNPWNNIPEYKIYSDQLKASYEEAKRLFETDTTSKTKH
jgi:hypothetical protein